MNLSFSIWCEDAIGNVKKALQQLTDIKFAFIKFLLYYLIFFINNYFRFLEI